MKLAVLANARAVVRISASALCSFLHKHETLIFYIREIKFGEKQRHSGLLGSLQKNDTSSTNNQETQRKMSIPKRSQSAGNASDRKQSNNSTSKFDYVKAFEIQDILLKNTWIVVRLDGRNFRNFAEKHSFATPNDTRALHLMNRAAVQVMLDLQDVAMAYGQSDEYSFILRKETTLHQRYASKISTHISTMFTANYVYYWKDYFDGASMKNPPAFDSNIMIFPSVQNLRDYLSWRQADCHTNNLYSTTFWALIQKGGLSNSAAEQRLVETTIADKNEILFSQFGINYNKELDLFKKGTTLLRKNVRQAEAEKVIVVPLNVDLTGDGFWAKNTDVFDDIKGAPGDFDWIDAFYSCKEVVQQFNLVQIKTEDCK